MNKHTFTYQSSDYTFYQIGAGSKKVLVLHGWGSSFKSWQHFFNEANKQDFTYYFPELPGFGDSPNPPTPWTVQDYLGFCKAFAEQIQPNYLLVHSFGGRIALKWLNEVNTFGKAIFVGAAGIKPKLRAHQKMVQNAAKVFKPLQKFPPIKFAKKIATKLIGAEDYQKAEGTLKQTFLNVIAEDLTDNLKNIHIPVELVWGKGDTYTPLWMGMQMNQLIPKSNLTIIDEARHGVHMQTPAKLAKIVENFFH